ncbi:MAG: ATP-binding cassette domain-containing protein, partial [SAR324 cluster bacterium]|nr:ATP-binding cassette domain-containing protein [SAR324 cluster bacterium]
MLIDQFKENENWVKGLMKMPHFAQNTFDLLLASAFINILSLALPLTLMQVYDRIIPHESMGTLTWLTIGCTTAVILEAVLRLSRSFISGWMAARFEHIVSCSAVERIMTSRIEQFEQFETGAHLDRLNAISTLRGFYAGQVFQVLLDLPFALIFLFAIWFLAGNLVFFPIILMILFLGIVSYFKTNFQAARDNQMVVNDRRFNFIIEILSGIHAIKSMHMEEQILRRYARLQGQSAEINMETSRWSMLPANVGVLFSQITMYGIIGIGAGSVLDGFMTVGSLTACMMLGGRAMQPIQSAAGFWMRFSEASLARSRLQELAAMELETLPDTPPLPLDFEGAIELKGVSFRYDPQSAWVVKDANLKVEPNHIIAVMGENSGTTTTLLYLLMGMLKPETGSVLIDDYHITQWDTTELRQKIAYFPPTGVLFSGTIMENITMFDHSKHFAAMDAAALMGLDEHVANLPLGYQTRVGGQSTNFLPTGLIQRIAIARALVHRPRILLFDRANGVMDKETEEVVLDL